MEIVGSCLNCFSSSGCFLVNSGIALTLLIIAVWRGGLDGSVAR